jgi:hypothetical protein
MTGAFLLGATTARMLRVAAKNRYLRSLTAVQRVPCRMPKLRKAAEIAAAAP